MSSDARLRLRRRLEEVLGGDAALILMDHLPERHWSDVVRRDDLDRATVVMGTQFRTEMDALGTQLRTEMDALGTQFRTEMDALGTQLRTEMDALGTQLRSEMQSMRHELTALFRSELHAAFSSQTRMVIYANVGMMSAAVAMSVALSRAIGGG